MSATIEEVYTLLSKDKNIKRIFIGRKDSQIYVLTRKNLVNKNASRSYSKIVVIEIKKDGKIYLKTSQEKYQLKYNSEQYKDIYYHNDEDNIIKMFSNSKDVVQEILNFCEIGNKKHCTIL